jgi:hypothetical protein
VLITVLLAGSRQLGENGPPRQPPTRCTKCDLSQPSPDPVLVIRMTRLIIILIMKIINRTRIALYYPSNIFRTLSTRERQIGQWSSLRAHCEHATRWQHGRNTVLTTQSSSMQMRHTLFSVSTSGRTESPVRVAWPFCGTGPEAHVAKCLHGSNTESFGAAKHATQVFPFSAFLRSLHGIARDSGVTTSPLLASTALRGHYLHTMAPPAHPQRTKRRRTQGTASHTQPRLITAAGD